ncbi:MAG: amino acid permease [Gammaproteobacteria bacterium]
MKTKTLGAGLLIVGTCIGAAMLTLPITTATSGFVPSLLLLAGTWLLMLYTGFLVVEVNLQCPEGSNFFTMAKDKLGHWGKYTVLTIYIGLLYSLMAAYETGGGALATGILQTLTHHPIPHWFGDLVITLLFASVIFFGTQAADYINRFFIIGLFLTYLCLMLTTLPHMHIQYLSHGHANYLITAMPLFFTAYGFHIVIPTLRQYLNSNIKQIKIALLFGSTLCFIIYFFWQLAIFGVVPATGKNSLQGILNSGQPSTHLTMALSELLKSHWITTFSTFFTFFALGTSFVGVSLSLFDFLMDTLTLSVNTKGRLSAVSIAFVPPFIFAWLYPKGFILALGYAGVFVAILHGIMPAAMAWIGRRQQQAITYLTPGGSIGLAMVMLLSLVVIVAEFL